MRAIWSVSNPQSHKNPRSVAALLRGNFASLVDFAEIFTKIHAVLSQNSLQVPGFFYWKILKKNILFCWKLSTKTAATLLDISTKVSFIVNFHQKMPLWQISSKVLPLWNIFTKLCLVGKFPQQQALLANFHKKKLLFQNISTKSCWKSFINNLFCWKISTKKCCNANFHRKWLFGETYTTICFVWKFP